MRSSNAAKAAPGVSGNGLHEVDRLASKVTSSNTDKPQVGQLIDKYGHVHSEGIFRNWSPAAIRALGIRRVGEKGGAE